MRHNVKAAAAGFLAFAAMLSLPLGAAEANGSGWKSYVEALRRQVGQQVRLRG